MAQVTWTSQAIADLDAVCLFIARDAPRYAELFAARVMHTTERLAEFPRSGRVVPELGREDIREAIVLDFRVIYRLRSDHAEILTVHHGARLLRDLDVSDRG